MKKKYFVLTAVMLICMFVLSGCGKSPKSVVDKFCKGMKDFDYATMNECLADASNSVENSLEKEDEMDVFTSFIKEQAKEMKYEIIDVSDNNDEAVVSVEFVFTDASPVLLNTLSEYLSQGLALAFAGAGDDQMETLLQTIFNQQIADATLVKTKENVAINCKKVDKEWKITDISDELLNVMTCNIVKTIQSFDGGSESSNSGTTSNSDTTSGTETLPQIVVNSNTSDSSSVDITSETSESTDSGNNTAFTFIPVGQEVQLATLKMTVVSCEESRELTSKYSDPVAAQDGTKYVVYTIKIENTTNAPSEFSASDIPLVDNQGRYFSMDTDATFSLDDYILYRETNPNIPETGKMVFKVPDDATGYGFCVENANTGEQLCFVGQ